MNRIKQLREEFNLTQLQLAKSINKTQQVISLYENGTNEPDLDTYILLANMFNCSIEYVAGKDNMRNEKAYKLFDINTLNKDEINDIKIYIEFLKFRKNKNNSAEII